MSVGDFLSPFILTLTEYFGSVNGIGPPTCSSISSAETSLVLGIEYKEVAHSMVFFKVYPKTCIWCPYQQRFLAVAEK
jgi:hypothetical protein